MENISVVAGLYTGKSGAFGLDEGSTDVYKASTFKNVDFTYTGDLSGMFGSRSVGNLYGEYDEFFFNSQAANGQTVTIKDYAKDPKGYKMLGLEAPGENNKWYAVNPLTNTAYESYEVAEKLLNKLKEQMTYGVEVIIVDDGCGELGIDDIIKDNMKDFPNNCKYFNPHKLKTNIASFSSFRFRAKVWTICFN